MTEESYKKKKKKEEAKAFTTGSSVCGCKSALFSRFNLCFCVFTSAECNDRVRSRTSAAVWRRRFEKKKGAVHHQSSCSPKKVNEFPKAAVTPHPSDVSTKATNLSLSSQTHALCNFFSFFKHTSWNTRLYHLQTQKNQDTYSAPTIKNTEYVLLYLHLKI